MKMIALICGLLVARVAAVDREPLYKWFEGIDPENVLYAVNCGAEEPHTDLSGITYNADEGYSGGEASSAGSSQKWVIVNSDVYQTERWASEDFNYGLPFDPNVDAKYVVVLKFSEQYFREPYMKVFDVALGDTTVLKELDIFARAGQKLLPFDEFIEIEMKRGKLYFNGRQVRGALRNNKLHVNFNKGSVDNPKINAIVLVQGGIDNTHKKSFLKFQKTLKEI